ncbi:unnamed protein product [Durusdinium trenchii]|uniref:Uncharacterized protein n=1 Tax=Durusdinium trenchii TaxID=1381693 RepID=A0ABP0PAQ4_9DINO
MLEKLQHRAQSLENSIQHTKQTLGKLEEALEAKDAPLILCSWRMEQRERRPLREQVRDHVEVSLETEKAALLDSQRRLQDVIQKTKQTVQALENKLEEVRQDIQQKSQALSVDELCLRTTSRSLEQIVDRSAFLRTAGGNLPPARGGSRGTARGADARREVTALESFRNEVLRQKEALRLNQSAIHREEAAKELREEANKLMARVQRNVEDAAGKSEKCMKDRVNENQLMRRQEHQMTLLKCHEELRQHHQNEKNILQDLQEKKEQLKEDLRDKTSALHIDLNCLTHEAQPSRHGQAPRPAISRQRLPKAMKAGDNECGAKVPKAPLVSH